MKKIVEFGFVVLLVVLSGLSHLCSSDNPDVVIVQTLCSKPPVLSELMRDKFLRFQLTLNKDYEWELVCHTKNWLYELTDSDTRSFLLVLPKVLLRVAIFLQLKW
jgi:hypothetical protein